MIVPLERRSGVAYIAVGADLLASAQAGAAGIAATVVEPAALVLGSAQPDSDVAHGACAAAGLTVIRRGTGGGAVLCDSGVLLIDIAVPRGHALATEDVTEAYRPLGSALAVALRVLAVPCRTVTVTEARQTDDDRRSAARRACWAGLSPYEIVLDDDRKLVGLAQRRRSGAVLFQIAVPVSSAPRDVARYLLRREEIDAWLTSSASLVEVPACLLITPDALWEHLRGSLEQLLRD